MNWSTSWKHYAHIAENNSNNIKSKINVKCRNTLTNIWWKKLNYLFCGNSAQHIGVIKTKLQTQHKSEIVFSKFYNKVYTYEIVLMIAFLTRHLD